MTRAKARFLAFLLPFGMAACSTSGGYPSLALRDVERINGTGTPVNGAEAPLPPALPPASADLRTRLQALVRAAHAADHQFQTNRPAAARAVSAAGSLGSDSWSAASIALARLESSRSNTMGSLAQLDELYADARDAAPTQESPSALAIGESRAEVAALLTAQDSVIAGLASRLKS